MNIRRIAVSAAFAAGFGALPLAAANAQYYRPCPPFVLTLPFCVAGAVVVGAATIATAPIRALAGPPYYPPYYRRPYYGPRRYYGPRYYGPPPYYYGPR